MSAKPLEYDSLWNEVYDALETELGRSPTCGEVQERILLNDFKEQEDED